MTFQNFYTVQRTWDDGAQTSHSDNTADWDRAYDMFAETLEDGHVARVIYVEFVADTGAFERATEVTDEFEAEYARICAERGLPYSIAAE